MTHVLKKELLQEGIVAQIPTDSQQPSVPNTIRVQADVCYLVFPARVRVEEPEELFAARVSEIIVPEDELRNRSAREDLLDDLLRPCGAPPYGEFEWFALTHKRLLSRT